MIKINGKTVFSCYPDGTGAFYEMWLEKKANMVRMREMSTLRAFLELEKNGEDLKKDWNQTFSGKRQGIKNRNNT